MLALLDLVNNPAPDDLSDKKRVLRDGLVEFLATTVFVWAGTLSAVSTGDKLAANGVGEDVARILPIAVSFGVSILALAFSIGHLTGGHMNPGVTALMYFRRQMSLPKMLIYWGFQFLGSILASSIVWGCSSGLTGISKTEDDVIASPPFLLGSTTLNPDLTTANGFLCEFMGSFFFYFVIAQTALDKRGVATTPFPAIPIGLVLVVVHICLIPFTGCGVNPARSFGPAVVTCMSADGVCSDAMGSWYWIYFAGPFLASYAVAEVTTWIALDFDGDEPVPDESVKEHAEVKEIPTSDLAEGDYAT